MKPSRHRCGSALAALFALAIAVTLCSNPRPAAAEIEVVFLDPDANLTNIARLRAKMTRFLRTIDASARFKTFAKLSDLRRYLKTNRIDFALISAEVSSQLDFDMLHVLTPVRGGSTNYHKVLVVRRGTTANDIKVVATTSSVAEVTAIELPGRSPSAARLRVLRVSKGFDALLGMTFNRADAAYVTPETVAELERVDKKLAANLREIYRSPPIPNPRLFAVTKNVDAATRNKVSRAFKRMHRTPAGRAVLAILDYTGWSNP